MTTTSNIRNTAISLTPHHNTYECTAANCSGNITLLHGWGLHSIAWDTVIPALLKHFHVTIIDLPGMGLSPLPKDNYTLNFLVEQVMSVAPEQSIWLGWSLGGVVALQAAAQYPERITHVITTGTNAKFTRCDDWPHAIEKSVLEKFREIYEEDAEGTLIRFLALQCKGSASYKNDVVVLKEILYFCGLPSKRALKSGLEILMNYDLRHIVKSIGQPTLHILGTEDHLVPASASETWNNVMPSAQIALLKDQAHTPFISDPELFSQAVLEFLIPK